MQIQEQNQRRFVNVEFDKARDRIKIVDVEDISELSLLARFHYSGSLANVDNSKIKFADQENNLIKTMKDLLSLNLEYFEEGGPCLMIFTGDQPLQFRSFDIKQLVAPEDVKIPVVSSDEPQFTAPPNWLDNVVDEILLNFKKQDGAYRVPPMALVRCSRGGKTRALKEIAARLKQLSSNLCVIYVSFNDYSRLQEWEQADPISALCRRIAYAALNQDMLLEKEKPLSFTEFSKLHVDYNSIISWLNQKPCILMIDELNLISCLSISNLETVNSFQKDGLDASNMVASSIDAASNFAQFLKVHFLTSVNRYFLFSSHVLPVLNNLQDFMDGVSSRGVLLKMLPTVYSLEQAACNLKLPDLNPQEVIYYGSLPSLIYLGRNNILSDDKLMSAINFCIPEYAQKNVKLMDLLETFFTGYADQKFGKILQFMDSIELNGVKCMKWIPHYMIKFFKRLTASSNTQIDLTTRSMLDLVCTFFDKFKETKEQSGESWESLFLVVLILRCVCGQLKSELLLPSFEDAGQFEACGISFNRFFSGSMNDVNNVQQLIDGMAVPQQLPHIAIYYPPNAGFQTYDVIVALYDKSQKRQLLGYQLKEGKNNPSTPALSGLFYKSFVIKGDPPQQPRTNNNQWYVASKNEIEKFFGVSGQVFTPMYWKMLMSNQ